MTCGSRWTRPGPAVFRWHPFDGFIDDVRVYNRALTATEIQNDMNAPVS
ncbi:LamG-like jellyroll fold domain-containing protein [Nonomuraea sp. NPDC049152]